MTITDQKVREKLVKIALNYRAKDAYANGNDFYDGLAVAILQSPDLRVTLVEPRYSVQLMDGGGVRNPCAIVKCGASSLAEFYDQRAAIDYCNWLNSKEPKS